MSTKLDRDFVAADLAAVEELLGNLTSHDLFAKLSLQSRREDLRRTLAALSDVQEVSASAKPADNPIGGLGGLPHPGPGQPPPPGPVPATEPNKGINLEYATDHIWTMEDKPGFIGLRLDCGDAGVIYFTPAQAAQVVKYFSGRLAVASDDDLPQKPAPLSPPKGDEGPKR